MRVPDKLKRGRQLALKLRQEHVTWLRNAIKHRFYVIGCANVISTVIQNDTVIAAHAHNHGNARGDPRQLFYLLRIDAVANKRLLEVLSKRVSANSTNHVDICTHSSCSNCLVSALSTWAGDKIFAANSLALLRHLICLDGDIHVQASKYNYFAHEMLLLSKSAAYGILSFCLSFLLCVTARQGFSPYRGK